MSYTVQQLADIAGISVRTLHYYDEVGILKPTQVKRNGYRFYEEATPVNNVLEGTRLLSPRDKADNVRIWI